jgi:hypothetical protein
MFPPRKNHRSEFKDIEEEYRNAAVLNSHRENSDLPAATIPPINSRQPAGVDG